MNMQNLVDWARREPLLALAALVMVDLVGFLIWEWCTKTKNHRLLAGVILTTVLAAVTLNHLYPPKEAPPEEHHEPPPPQPLPSSIDFPKLLGKQRNGIISKIFPSLGKPDEERSLTTPVGRELCFRDKGVDLRFDDKDVLDKVALFSGFPGDSHRACDERSLPLGLRLKQARIAAEHSIDDYLRRHREPESCGIDCDKYEFDEYRLYLFYGELDGMQKIREVQLVRPEVFPQVAGSITSTPALLQRVPR
jgi:hypothetical protein